MRCMLRILRCSIQSGQRLLWLCLSLGRKSLWWSRLRPRGWWWSRLWCYLRRMLLLPRMWNFQVRHCLTRRMRSRVLCMCLREGSKEQRVLLWWWHRQRRCSCCEWWSMGGCSTLSVRWGRWQRLLQQTCLLNQQLQICRRQSHQMWHTARHTQRCWLCRLPQ